MYFNNMKKCHFLFQFRRSTSNSRLANRQSQRPIDDTKIRYRRGRRPVPRRQILRENTYAAQGQIHEINHFLFAIFK